MHSIKIKKGLSINFEDFMNGAASMPTEQLEYVQQQLGKLLVKRKKDSLPEQEAALLEAINQMIPNSLIIRYKALKKLQKKAALPVAEYAELLAIIQKIEAFDALRLKNLLELAALRSVSLDALMDTLGIRLPAFHA